MQERSALYSHIKVTLNVVHVHQMSVIKDVVAHITPDPVWIELRVWTGCKPGYTLLDHKTNIYSLATCYILDITRI